MKDLRLYIYDQCIFRKDTHKHRFNSIEEINKHIELTKSRRFNYQYVVVEYTGLCQSKIIKIINT